MVAVFDVVSLKTQRKKKPNKLNSNFNSLFNPQQQQQQIPENWTDYTNTLFLLGSGNSPRNKTKKENGDEPKHTLKPLNKN